jgi:CHAT domain
MATKPLRGRRPRARKGGSSFRSRVLPKPPRIRPEQSASGQAARPPQVPDVLEHDERELARLVLRTPSAGDIEVDLENDRRQLQRDAMYWAYVVRSRRRWVGTELATASPVDRLLSVEQLRQIAKEGLVEVDVPYGSEDKAWELRVMPWEHLLSHATKPYRTDRPLTVVRRLRKTGDRFTPRGLLEKVVVVKSAPAGLAQYYNVTAEAELMLNSLGISVQGTPIVEEPTPDQLAKAMSEHRPTLVHLAGVDNHQAAELLNLVVDDDQRRMTLDGMVCRGSAMRPELVSAYDLAGALSPEGQGPEFVLCNFYNSAARTAALAVARGARAAVGYQDFIEDTLAADFCTTFYRGLRAGTALRESFEAALDSLRKRPAKLEGACVVLWSAESLVAPAARPATGRRDRARKSAVVPSQPQSAPLRPVDAVRPIERIRVDAKAHDAINYSLLHNRRSLFKTLDIYRRDVIGPIEDIVVSAMLYVGEESFPFRLNVTMAEGMSYLPLADRVVVPLTSSVIRTQSESMQSSLFLEVKCGEATVFAETVRVQLSPVDEWTDTNDNRWWLPSFVLPRDPAVSDVIDRAQRYLMAMADDPTAGFDGYQSVDDSASSFEARYAPVDLQVRAIWSALLYDFDLHYINPPPSYAISHQRLRTPSEVIRGRRGTCIDLALLLSACLEYVDIYPVVFLLAGHAFPGYWRSRPFHDEFQHVTSLPLPEDPDPDALDARAHTTARFEDAYALKNFYETRALIAAGKVVPLETVWLTTHGPFADAVEEGRRNLRRVRDFDSMIDLVRARANGVTPLPVLWRSE